MNEGGICISHRGQLLTICFVFALFVLAVGTFAHADTITWTNGGGTGSWHFTTNWSPAQVPTDGDDVIIPAGSDPATYSSGTTNLNTFSCGGSLTISGGTLTLAAASTVSGSLTFSSGTLGGSGDITISGDFSWAGGTVTGSGGFTTSGTWAIAAGGVSVSLNGRTLTNTGTATWSGWLVQFKNDARIDNESSISINVDSGSTFNLGSGGTSSGRLVNTGTLSLVGGGGTVVSYIPFDNSGTVNISSGTLRLMLETTNNGTIRGTGTLNVSGIEFINSGSINPGTSPGTLTITGSLQQSPLGTLNMEIAGTTGSDYDQLTISGHVNLSGLLNLSLFGGFLPADGYSFPIVTFSTVIGMFTQIVWPPLNPGLAWEFRALSNAIEIYCGTDSDLDGLPDTLENASCTEFDNNDTDDDQLLDGSEDLNKNGQVDPGETDPCDWDTDNDTMPDGWEIENNLDPLVNDCTGNPDDDGLTNCEEYENDTDPHDLDTDDDTMTDGWEVENGLDPLVDDRFADKDGDGFPNWREYLAETEPDEPGSIPPNITIYVDDDNTTGIEDGTQVRPFDTLQEGVNYGGPGDSVSVAAGSYEENVLIQRSIIMAGEGADVTTIDGGTSTEPTVRFHNVTNGGIKGFHILNGTTAGIAAEQSTLEISEIDLTGNGDGVFVDGGSSLVVENSMIHGNRQDGINASQADTTLSVVNNTIVGNGGDGVALYKGNNVTIANNIISSNDNYGISCNQMPEPDLSNNNVWDNALDDYFGCSAGAGSMSQDPLFKDSASHNYHLTADSQCVDSGKDQVAQHISHDLDGEPRFLDADADGTATVDIGADEFGDPFIESLSYEGCISGLCTYQISVTAHDPREGDLSYTWETLNGGTVIGSGSDVEFEPLETGPHPIPYRIQVTVTSDVSGLSTSQVIEIYVNLAGDCNGDGTVTSADVTCVIIEIFNPTGSLSADCNGDGSVTSADVTCTIIEIFNP